jgi:hypothetical protein
VVLLESMQNSGQYTFGGMIWSVLAGTAGALGALGIILAFTYGGKPIFVMPLVFGFAPVINTLTSIVVTGRYESVNALFAGALALGIAGAVTVLLNAPKAKPHGAPGDANATVAAADDKKKDISETLRELDPAMRSSHPDMRSNHSVEQTTAISEDETPHP